MFLVWQENTTDRQIWTCWHLSRFDFFQHVLGLLQNFTYALLLGIGTLHLPQGGENFPWFLPGTLYLNWHWIFGRVSSNYTNPFTSVVSLTYLGIQYESHGLKVPPSCGTALAARCHLPGCAESHIGCPLTQHIALLTAQTAAVPLCSDCLVLYCSRRNRASRWCQ